jgi:DNA-damage-inducible protein D
MSDPKKSSDLAKEAFGEVTSPAKGANASLAKRDETIDQLIARFEDAAQTFHDDGPEFWFARDLQELLGYQRWDTFVEVLAKAQISCEQGGQLVADHFSEVRKMVSIGSNAEREILDFRLSRYACYLVAQNGDARKKPIAFAQTYFAIQTRRAELNDEEEEEGYSALSEDQKRVLLRDEIKEHNKYLASAAKGAGVIKPLDFAIFQTYGYKGLYGGLDRQGIQRRKGLKSKQQILDHMGSAELAANLFRATQTEEKLRRENIRGKEAANNTHYDVGRRVRQAIKDIGGTMPEALPVAEDISKVARRLKKGVTNKKLTK